MKNEVKEKYNPKLVFKKIKVFSETELCVLCPDWPDLVLSVEQMNLKDDSEAKKGWMAEKWRANQNACWAGL